MMAGGEKCLSGNFQATADRSMSPNATGVKKRIRVRTALIASGAAMNDAVSAGPMITRKKENPRRNMPSRKTARNDHSIPADQNA
jgi:hypothetical protein